MRALVLLAVLAASGAAPLSGQVLRGRVVDDVSGQPVVAAVVELVDGEGDRRDAFLSEPDGGFVLRTPGPGPWRVRIQRLGYRTAVAGPFEVPAAGADVGDVRFEPAPVRLRGITAEGAQRCVVNPETGVQTALLWDEARKVLATAALVHERELVRFEALRYRRDLGPDRAALFSEHLDLGVMTRPFRSPPPGTLLEEGFVQAENDSAVYYMPDPATVLSDEFLASHCFHIATRRGPEGRFVGLAFRPLPDSRNPDVDGVLWLDEEDGALTSVEYRYVGLAREDWEERSGGRAEFERLGTGHWIVRRWAIRMPVVGRPAVRRGRFRGLEVVGITEEGGEVLAAYGTDGRVVTRAHAHRIRGVVRDSLRNAPLAGATVRLSGTLEHGVADAEGRFAFEALPPGEYVVVFHHPVLDTLGFPSRARVVRVPLDETVRLAVPSRESAVARLCPDGVPRGRPGVLHGTVVSAATGEGVETRLDVLLPGTGRRFRARTDERGRWRVCGITPGVVVEVRVQEGDGVPVGGSITLPEYGVGRLDLVVGDPGGEPGGPPEARPGPLATGAARPDSGNVGWSVSPSLDDHGDPPWRRSTSRAG